MSDTASRFDRSHFTEARDQAHADGEDVVIELNITTLDRRDPGEICTLCPTPAAMLVEVWQSYRRDGRDLRDMTSTYDPLCRRCAETYAPGLFAAVRNWETVKLEYQGAYTADADDGWRHALAAASENALTDVQNALPGALMCLGFDEDTGTEAIAGISRTVVQTMMTSVRIIGTHVPGGELHFMPDDSDPDGPLGDVSRTS